MGPKRKLTQKEQNERNKSKAEKQRLRRQQETPEKAEERKRKDRERKQVKRAAEKAKDAPLPPATVAAHLEDATTGIQTPGPSSLQRMNQTVSNSSRKNQTPEKRAMDQEINTQRKKAKRALEPNDVAAVRRESDSSRHAQTQRNADEETTANRRHQDAIRHAEVWNNEPQNLHQQRLQRRNEQRASRQLKTYRLALKSLSRNMPVLPFYLGPLHQTCVYCGAIHFKGERQTDGKFTTCCNKGRVMPPPPEPYPEVFTKLLTRKHEHSATFLERIQT